MKHSIQDEITHQAKRNVFVVLSGPTASGKDTVLEAIVEKHPNAVRIITTTSRTMRPGESEGHPYYFMAREDFEKKIANHEFFEWVEFRGQLYGTQKKTLEDALASGQDVFWKIEAKGVKNIKDKVKHMTQRSVLIYLTASNLEMLEQRVRKDENGVKTDRWNPSLAAWEMEQYDDCEYLIVNDDGNLDNAISQIQSIIEAKKLEIIPETE